MVSNKDNMFADEGLFSISKGIMVAGFSWPLEIQNLGKGSRIIYDALSFLTKYYYGLIGVSSFLAFVKMCMVVPDIAFESLSKTIYIFILFVKVLLCESKSMVKLTTEFRKEESKILSSRDNSLKKTYLNEISFSRKLLVFTAASTPFVGGQLILTAWWDAYNIPRMHRFDNESYEVPPATYLIYPFDEKKHPILALIIQTYAILNTIQYTSSTFAFRLALMAHLAAQFKILQFKLRNFNKGETQMGAYFSIKKLIQEHQNLIKSMWKLNKSLKNLILLEYLVSSLIFATTVLQILTSVGLGDALYESKWYNLDKKTKYLVPIVIHRCQKPLTISIGPFGPLEANDAISRIRLVYSYVTLITGLD